MKANLKDSKMNKVKTVLTVVACIAAFAGASSALARGGVDSGGGGAFLCKDGTTHLLDLWEVENIYKEKLRIPRSNEDADLQLKRALLKLKPYDSKLGDELYQIAKKLFSEQTALAANLELEPPRDANTNYKMMGCYLTGMMFYDGNLESLVIDTKLFSKLANQTEVAAAMLHEAWYYKARLYKDIYFKPKDSINTRRLVGCLFSDSTTCLEKNHDSVDRLQSEKQEYASKYLCENNEVKFQLQTNSENENDKISILRIKDRVFPKGSGVARLFHSSAITQFREFDLILEDENFPFFILGATTSLNRDFIKSGASSGNYWYFNSYNDYLKYTRGQTHTAIDQVQAKAICNKIN